MQHDDVSKIRNLLFQQTKEKSINMRVCNLKSLVLSKCCRSSWLDAFGFVTVLYWGHAVA
jgi:hypothetical protein